jgi:hypothetical protein
MRQLSAPSKIKKCLRGQAVLGAAAVVHRLSSPQLACSPAQLTSIAAALGPLLPCPPARPPACAPRCCCPPVVCQPIGRLEGVAVHPCGVRVRHRRRVHRNGVDQIGVDGRAVALTLPVARNRDLGGFVKSGRAWAGLFVTGTLGLLARPARACALLRPDASRHALAVRCCVVRLRCGSRAPGSLKRLRPGRTPAPHPCTNVPSQSRWRQSPAAQSPPAHRPAGQTRGTARERR